MKAFIKDLIILSNKVQLDKNRRFKLIGFIKENDK